MKIKYKNFAKNIRKNILKLSFQAKSSHIGSCLSIVDIIVVLYLGILKTNLKNYKKKYFILSKGHACLALYCLLYEIGIIKKKLLFSYGEDNSILMQHASHHVKGVVFSTGSLGHGLPVATGMALSNKIKKNNNKVYVLLSDGEMNEGSTWEALLFASHHKLNNLIIILDYNKFQSLTLTKKTLNIEPLRKKFQSFGCKVISINGHNYSQIFKSLKLIDKKKPLVIIANTIKGKGISYMENNIAWHYRSPTKDELNYALNEIENA